MNWGPFVNLSSSIQSTTAIKRTYYVIISLFWFATALPMALSILLMQARGVDLFQVGLFMGVYSFTIVVLEVPTGGLADAIGRKRVTLLAYLFIACFGLVFLFAFSFAMFMLAAVLYGIGRALSSGALDAWFIDALHNADPDIDLQPALATANNFTLLSLGSGLLLGSLIPRLFNWLPPDGTAVLSPYSMPIVFSLGAKIVLIILTIILVKENRPASKNITWRQGFQEVPTIIKTGLSLSHQNSILRLLLGATLAAGLVLITLETLWQPHFAALLGGSEGNSLFFGLVMGGNFIVGMVGNMLATPLSRLLNNRYGLVCAIFQGLQGVMLLLLASQATIPLAVLFFWLLYFNLGVMDSPYKTLLNREIPSKHRSAMLSIASFVNYGGAIIGSIGLGYIAQYASINTAWIIGGLVLGVSLGLYLKIDWTAGVYHPLPSGEEHYA